MKTINQTKEELFKAISRIGKVAEIKIAKEHTDAVIGLIHYLLDTFYRIIGLLENDRAKFYRIFISEIKIEEIRERVKSKGRKPIVDKSEYINIDEKGEPTSLSPNEPSEVYVTEALMILFTDVFFRIWKSSYEVNNIDVQREVFLTHYKILEKLFTIVNEQSIYRTIPILSIFLDSFYKTLTAGLKEKDQDKKRVLVHPSYNWYLNAVFHKKFELSFLNIFDKHLFKTVRLIMAKDAIFLYKNFVSASVQNTNVNEYSFFQISDSLKRIDELELVDTNKRADAIGEYNELYLKRRDLFSISQLENWQVQLDHHIGKFYSQASADKKLLIEEITSEFIDSAKAYFKYNNLRLSFIVIGSYAVFKGKFDFVNYQLHFNQPLDSSAHWVGKDINPISIEEITRLLILKDYILREVWTQWEDHHGIDTYYYQYFLILFSHAINLSQRGGIFLLDDASFLFIRDLPKIDKTSLKYRIAEILNHIHKENLLKIEGVSDGIIKEALPQLLEKLATHTETYIKRDEQNAGVDEKLLTDFKEAVIKHYNMGARIRNIYKHFKAYEWRDTMSESKLNYIGVNEISTKGAFVSDSRALYYNWGGGYGDSLAQMDNNFILHKLRNKCEEIKIDEAEVESVLNKQDLKNKFIISINLNVAHEILSDPNIFNPNWLLDEATQTSYANKGLTGLYKDKMEIFHLYKGPGNQKTMYVLNKGNLGTLVQYNPLDTNPENGSLEDVFFFKFITLSENADILNGYLDDPERWLKEKGNRDAQKSFLLESVWIRFLEKLDVTFDSKFKGECYIIE